LSLFQNFLDIKLSRRKMKEVKMLIKHYKCGTCKRHFCIPWGERTSFDVDFGCPYGCDDAGELISSGEAVIPRYFTSKDAVVIISKDDATSWWFEFNGRWFVIDYIPQNYPQLEVGYFFGNRQEAYERLKEMCTLEGWCLLKDNIGLSQDHERYAHK